MKYLACEPCSPETPGMLVSLLGHLAAPALTLLVFPEASGPACLVLPVFPTTMLSLNNYTM